MNNLKIKFGLFSLLAVLAVSFFLTSCEQENIETPITFTESDKTEQRVMEMVGDMDYQEFDRLQRGLLSRIFEVMDKNNIATSELHSIYKEDGGESLNELFSDESIMEIQQELSQAAEKLTAKYGDILITDNGLETQPTIEEVFMSLANAENALPLTELRDCSWRYTLCSATATTVYVACVAGATAITAGTGAALAAVACSFVYAYAMTECHRKHCD